MQRQGNNGLSHSAMKCYDAAYMGGEYSVAVLINAKGNIPLIRDPKKPAPVYWKLPGGRSERDETAEECAVREVQEEVGISLKIDQLKEIYTEYRSNHVLVIFQANLPSLPPHKSVGNEREEVRVFAAKDISSMHDFFPNHKKAVAKVLAQI
jgi:ADP-ribose pyrophosphatase YjhB (NUDIX family)